MVAAVVAAVAAVVATTRMVVATVVGTAAAAAAAPPRRRPRRRRATAKAMARARAAAKASGIGVRTPMARMMLPRLLLPRLPLALPLSRPTTSLVRVLRRALPSLRLLTLRRPPARSRHRPLRPRTLLVLVYRRGPRPRPRVLRLALRPHRPWVSLRRRRVAPPSPLRG